MTKQEFLLLLDDFFCVQKGTTTEATDLRASEQWDSMQVLGFMALVDQELNAQVQGRAVEAASTVGDLLALLDEHLHDPALT